MELDRAEVVLHLRIRIPADRHEAFRDYVREAFPVFEAEGGCRGAVYQDAQDPERFDEVFYYDSEAAYQRGEQAIETDPVQAALLARWRALLAAPPEVEVMRRWT